MYYEGIQNFECKHCGNMVGFAFPVSKNNYVVQNCMKCGNEVVIYGSEYKEPKKSTSENNGGDTDYYKIKEDWKMLQDIIEDREMNYAQANILKSSFAFNVGRHNGTDYERELNKIIWFAQRELKRISDDGTN